MNYVLLASFLNKETASFHLSDVFQGVVLLVHSNQNASQPLNGNIKQPGFVWLYQCLINSLSSTPEETVFQFCSSILFLWILLLCLPRKYFCPRWFMGNIAVLDLVKLGFCDTCLIIITKAVDWDCIMMTHLPIMFLSKGSISSSMAVLGRHSCLILRCASCFFSNE